MINLKGFEVDKVILLITILRKCSINEKGMFLRDKSFEVFKGNEETLQLWIKICNVFMNNPDVYKIIKNNSEMLGALEKVFETQVFKDIYEETLDYRKDLISRCSVIAPKVSDYVLNVLGIKDEKEIIVNITNPDFHTGTNNGRNEVFFGHFKSKNNPNYEAVYILHECLHCVYPYEKEWNEEQIAICHSLIELASDNELMYRLSGKYGEYDTGHNKGKGFKSELLPLWYTFLSTKPGFKDIIHSKDATFQMVENFAKENGVQNMDFSELMNFCIEHYKEFVISNEKPNSQTRKEHLCEKDSNKIQDRDE